MTRVYQVVHDTRSHDTEADKSEGLLGCFDLLLFQAWNVVDVELLCWLKQM